MSGDATATAANDANIVAASEHGLLEVRGLVKRFGGVTAVNALDMTVRRGDVHALIGPNGSGKTTTLNLLSGLYRADGGSARFDGVELVGKRPHQITALGIARTFQNIRLFANLTVLENVMIGRHARTAVNALTALVPGGPAVREERESRERALELLAFTGAERFAMLPARSLSYGDQRRVEIARALAAEPALLFLDEPAAGMNPAETEALIELLYGIRKRGTTLLLIEHDMNLVMTISDSITVLNFGTHIAEGTAQDVSSNPDVISAYLGGSIDAAAAR